MKKNQKDLAKGISVNMIANLNMVGIAKYLPKKDSFPEVIRKALADRLSVLMGTDLSESAIRRQEERKTAAENERKAMDTLFTSLLRPVHEKYGLQIAEIADRTGFFSNGQVKNTGNVFCLSIPYKVSSGNIVTIPLEVNFIRGMDLRNMSKDDKALIQERKRKAVSAVYNETRKELAAKLSVSMTSAKKLDTGKGKGKGK
jgi:hypothetical protein